MVVVTTEPVSLTQGSGDSEVFVGSNLKISKFSPPLVSLVVYYWLSQWEILKMVLSDWYNRVLGNVVQSISSSFTMEHKFMMPSKD